MRFIDQLRHKNSKLLLTLGFLWLLALVSGLVLIAWYTNRAGEPGSPPAVLSETLPTTVQDNQYQLFMFVHPRCPCSRSSVRELKRLLERTSDSVVCTFFCFQPADQTKQWSETDIMKSTQSIPHSKIIYDIDGTWAKRFDAKTSGQVLLYAPSGNLLFNGGITAGRGHEGENSGKSFITQVVRDNSHDSGQSPVFGCPIFK